MRVGTTPGETRRLETDQELRERLFSRYCEGWGAFWSVVLEAKGKNLDELAECLGTERLPG